MVMETVEIPPRIELPGALCIFDKRVTKVSMEDNGVGIYMHKDGRAPSYFLCSEPYAQELSPEKVLYVFLMRLYREVT